MRELAQDEDVRHIVRDVHEQGLVVLRACSLPTLHRLLPLFGTSEVVLPAEHRLPGSTALRLQSNRPGQGVDGGGRYWHADGSWMAASMDVTLLLCLEAPNQGGGTEFVDAAALYDDWEPPERAWLDTLVGVFPNRSTLAADLRAMRLESSEMLARTQDTEHSVVRIHPYTGRRAVILNEVWMRSLRGMTQEEAVPVLRGLAARVEASPRRYSHRWAVGDLLVWDNHRVLHRAAPIGAGATKVTVRARVPRLHRTNLQLRAAGDRG